MQRSFFWMTLFSLVISFCGNSPLPFSERKQEESFAEENNEEACREKFEGLGDEENRMKRCEVDDDCTRMGLNPSYGCFFSYNKNENSKTLTKMIDRYVDECLEDNAAQYDCMFDDIEPECRDGECH